MEYSEYQRYRQQQQSRDSNTSENTDNTVVTLKHHNPSIEAAQYENDHNAAIELRQRVRIINVPSALDALQMCQP